MKTCSKCKELKPESEFYWKKERNNYASYCKECVYKWHKNYRKTNSYKINTHRWQQTHKQNLAQNSVKYRATLKGKYVVSKLSAKRHGANIYPDFITWASIISTPCVYCGELQQLGNGIDRVNSNYDYIQNNMVSCCIMCNKMKSDYSVEVWKNKIKQIYEKELEIKNENFNKE